MDSLKGPLMDLGLKDKRVLVTGSTRGIGLAVARAFAREGARVAVTGRDESALGAARALLGDDVSRHAFHSCDFGDPAATEALAARFARDWGGVDVVVANAGTGKSVPDPMPSQEAFARSFAQNFTTAENTARAFLPLLEKSRGSLLFVASIAGVEAIGAPTAYAVAKTALLALAKNLARKVAPAVRVNTVAPGNVFFEGGTWDEKRRADPAKVQAMLESAVPLRRFGTPEEIAAACLFLASPVSAFTTGATLVVDGGQTTQLF
jgi:3-oxoacyl-[acyl-carrier protein] reductase